MVASRRPLLASFGTGLLAQGASPPVGWGGPDKETVMTIIRRAAVGLAAMSALVLGATPAMAHDCTNSSKQAGAGSVADLYIVGYVVDGAVVGMDEYMGEDAKVNPQGKGAGAFFTIHGMASIDGAEPFEFLTQDVYIHTDLPDPARLGGPGDGACDGVGIDDLGTCFDLAIADLMAG
jgi:hypothetical protein